jgi:predicted DNA-binding transcriptional regulator YafY
MRLTMSELCALELGLTVLRRERTPAEQAPIDGAIKRLRQAITVVPSNDRHEGTRWVDLSASGSAEHLSALRGALAENRKASQRYRAGGETESTTRVVSPQSLVFAEQMWYLVATGEDDALRFFRLDRIEAVQPLEETCERDPAVVDQVRSSGRAFLSDTARSMTVRYAPRIARWVAEREGIELAVDGSLTLEHPVADESWAVRHVLQYGPDAELLSPPELRAVVASRLASMMEPTA